MRFPQPRSILAVFAVSATLGCGSDNLVGQIGGNHGDSNLEPATAAGKGVRLSPSSIPKAGIHRPYRAKFLAQGGTPGYVFSVSNGALAQVRGSVDSAHGCVRARACADRRSRRS